MEDRVHHARRNDCRRGAALDVGRSLNLEIVGRRDRIHRRAAFKLVEKIDRLVLDDGGDLVIAPMLFDVGFDVVIGAFLRRRNGGDVVPDIAAIGVDRIVVDADVGAEGRVDHLHAVRNIGGRLVVGVAGRCGRR